MLSSLLSPHQFPSHLSVVEQIKTRARKTQGPKELVQACRRPRRFRRVAARCPGIILGFILPLHLCLNRNPGRSQSGTLSHGKKKSVYVQYLNLPFYLLLKHCAFCRNSTLKICKISMVRIFNY